MVEILEEYGVSLVLAIIGLSAVHAIRYIATLL